LIVQRLVAELSRVIIADTGCWLWQGSLFTQGYGRFHAYGKALKAHRAVYELVAPGPIPEGMCIDHVWAKGCRYLNCVSPYHMEVVTPKVNSSRSIQARKTECVNGHPFDEENTFRDIKGFRQCRTCFRDRSTVARDAKRGCPPAWKQVRLTIKQQQEVYDLYSQGLLQKQLVEIYGCSITTIRKYTKTRSQ
jgi:hypothetical protein